MYFCLLDGSLLQPLEGGKDHFQKCSRKTCGAIYTNLFLDYSSKAAEDLKVNWEAQLAELQGTASD